VKEVTLSGLLQPVLALLLKLSFLTLFQADDDDPVN
jgi:hypothetical protein